MSARMRRLVLIIAAGIGLLVPAYFLGLAETPHFAWDFRAYYTAADAALADRPFVGIETRFPGVRFVYPPISVAMFLPHAALGGWKLAFVAQTVLNVIAASVLAILVIRTIEDRRGQLHPWDRIAISAFCLLSAPVMAVYGQGQVDLLIALAVAGAFMAVERGHESAAGGLLGGAALVKVFPAVLGIWLLWRRSYRAVASAIITGFTGLGVGALWFGPGAYLRYLTVLSERSRVAEFAQTMSPNFFAMSLYRPFSQLIPGVDPSLYAPLAILALIPTAGLVARQSQDFTGRLATYLVALVGMLLASPASNALYVIYVYYPVLTLLYLTPPRLGRSLLLAGTAAIAIPVQPAQIADVFAVAGVPPVLQAPLLTTIRAILTVASVPLIGLIAILTWCSLRVGIRRRRESRTVHPTGAD